jgi:hypothetical protein
VTTLLAINEPTVIRTFAADGYRLTAPIEFGPAGVIWRCASPDNRAGSVIVSQASHDDVEWIHASIAWVDIDPTYAELTLLQRAVFGRNRWAYQVFAPTPAIEIGTICRERKIRKRGSCENSAGFA